jgi:hypothetical protein
MRHYQVYRRWDGRRNLLSRTLRVSAAETYQFSTRNLHPLEAASCEAILSTSHSIPSALILEGAQGRRYSRTTAICQYYVIFQGLPSVPAMVILMVPYVL